MMARLLTQCIPLEGVKTRRGAKSSQSATKGSPKTEDLASSFQIPPYLSHLWHNVL